MAVAVAVGPALFVLASGRASVFRVLLAEALSIAALVAGSAWMAGERP